MLTLSEIKTEVDSLAAKIGPTKLYDLPTYGHSEDGARPHIEVDSRGYHYVIVERGQELSRFVTPEIDELLYKIFDHITFTLAFRYELENRVEMQDCRRIAFHRQVELLAKLSPRWGQREAEDHESILRRSPFDDASLARALLSTQVGWEKACEQYPLPTP